MPATKVYLAPGTTDMRAGIDRLSMTVQGALDLDPIHRMMQLLESSPLDEEQKQFVLMALKSTNRLTRLLSDILDLSRVEAGKMTIHETEFVPHEIVDSVSELFHVAVREKGIPLKCFIDPETPLRLIGDDVRVRQILFNLVGNALKFTLQGHVRLEVSPVSTDKEDVVRVLFSVSDTGIGIPDHKLDGLFMPFAQVDDSYTRDFQGAGLGLAIVTKAMGSNLLLTNLYDQISGAAMLRPH